MSGFQSPQLLTDLYRDLRDRRLLPLVLVLVVGIAVVPIALSSKATTRAPVPPPPATAVAKSSNAPPTEVVVSDPGLRDYRRRLSGDTPKDPFAQLFQASSTDESAAPSDLGASSATPLGTDAVSTATSGGAVGGTTDGGSTTVETRVETDTKVVFYRLKVRTGEVGGEMKTKDEVGPSAQLPSEAVPALVFLGANFNGDLEAQRAYFMVSNGVSSITGDGVCSLGDPCQLLSIKPGQSADFVWTDGRVYRIKLLAFQRHVRDQVPGDFVAGSGSGNGSGRAGPG